MDEYFKRIDQSKIAPFFLEKCKQLVKNCLDQGVTFYAISGYRDPKEQEALYAIGRTVDTDKKVVTNAKPYRSFHNFGLAIDFAKDADATKAGLQPSWKIEDYKLLADEAKKLGLAPGFYFKTFKEGPHIQTPFSGGSTLTMEPLMRDKGLQAVWDLVKKNLGE